MKVSSRQIWLEKGYEMISEHGFIKVKVETISKAIGKNKSSFYHYFGDWEGYEEALLNYHLSLTEIFAAKLSKCEEIIPGMINIFLEHKTDIFFHKQLRINRAKPNFKKCFEAVFQIFEDTILEKWKSFIMLQDQPLLASKILVLISENFLLRITSENYTYEWMQDYLMEIANLLGDIKPKS